MNELHDYTTNAQTLMKDKSQLLALLTQALMKAGSCREALQSVWNNFMTLIRLVKAWLKGDYREIPWRSVVTAVAAIIYFVSPVDAIPDFIPIIGYLDDATVISLAIAALGEDFNNFTAWESTL